MGWNVTLLELNIWSSGGRGNIMTKLIVLDDVPDWVSLTDEWVRWDLRNVVRRTVFTFLIIPGLLSLFGLMD